MIVNVKRTGKFLLLGLLTVSILGVTAAVGSHCYVKYKSNGKTYTSVNSIPSNRVGVLLGTSPKSRYTKQRNPFYVFRIEAAVKLYKAGKIKRILISGDNRRKNYNEPDMMKADLVAAGIPASHIYCDYAGFRTLDSMVRAKKVFGLSSFTVISQKFHNDRAIALASWQDVDAIGYNARDIKMNKGYHVYFRELLARAKMVLDMLINKQPHFLGEPIDIK